MPFTEVVTFRLKEGVRTEDFLAAAFRMDREFQPTQPGYVPGSRRTLRSPDGTWMISVDWETVQDSENSQAAFENAGEITEAYLGAMDRDSIAIRVWELFVPPAL
ncbi:hypothetical protein ABZ934_31445 [Streptomyces sp. NPDC046557]|uniref:hypothetical protein n=1 Tax=Streptomyces sp. NPDC046557 TaxID=3155372 RepID=UPI0034103148